MIRAEAYSALYLRPVLIDRTRDWRTARAAKTGGALSRPGGEEGAVDETLAAALRRSHGDGGGVKQRWRAVATSTTSNRTGRR